MRNPSAYYRPRTIAEAVRLLAQPHLSTVLLSGGAFRLAVADDPDYEGVVDLQAIGELSRIASDAAGLVWLGANATLADVAAHAVTPPLLRRALTRAIPPARRNGATLGEPIEFPAQAAEAIAALLVLDATVVFALPDEQRIPLAELDLTITQPSLPRKGLITALTLPAPTASQGAGAAQVARTPADEAIVCAAAVVGLDSDGQVAGARVALGGVWPEPARLAKAAAGLVGGPLDDAAIDRIAEVVGQEVEPVGDYRGSVDYRRSMASVMVRRALVQARATIVE
jgi:CO/xanthine dehydrogenase FAD-binding subunit